MYQIIGRKDIYTFDDAKAIQKMQYTAEQYLQLQDLSQGYSPERMLEIVKEPLNRSVFLRRYCHGDIFRRRRDGFCLLSFALSYFFVALMPFLRPFLHNRRNAAY